MRGAAGFGQAVRHAGVSWHRERFFRIYARNRLRLGVGPLELNRPLREEEVRANYDATRALVDSLDTPEESMMIRKPLESSQGGYYHGATRIFRGAGANVFASREDPGFQKLLSWSEGAYGDPNCEDPGSGRRHDRNGANGAGRFVRDARSPRAPPICCLLCAWVLRSFPPTSEEEEAFITRALVSNAAGIAPRVTSMRRASFV